MDPAWFRRLLTLAKLRRSVADFQAEVFKQQQGLLAHKLVNSVLEQAQARGWVTVVGNKLSLTPSGATELARVTPLLPTAAVSEVVMAAVPDWVKSVATTKNFRGPNGNEIVAYEWRWKWEEVWSQREDGMFLYAPGQFELLVESAPTADYHQVENVLLCQAFQLREITEEDEVYPFPIQGSPEPLSDVYGLLIQGTAQHLFSRIRVVTQHTPSDRGNY